MGKLRVGLVGAGTWAARACAPMLAAGPETTLAGVWARRPEAATQLAARHGVPTFTRYEELLDACEAVAFAVPPDVQAEMAVVAARRHKGLLLEKPVASDVAGAAGVAEAVAEAGVTSVVALTFRFCGPLRRFLTRAARIEPVGIRVCFVSGSCLPESEFASPWRLERGAVLDLGPHVVDLVEAVGGPIVGVSARAARGWVSVIAEHEAGVVSDAAMCAGVPLPRARTEIEVYGRHGALSADFAAGAHPDALDTIRREFAAACRNGGGHPLDARHGLHVQRVIARIERSLAAV